MPDSTNPPSSGLTRRRVLGGGAAATALAAASVALPGNVRKALASPPPFEGRGSLADIKHVVMLMQENRSFDHYFGTLSGVRGFSDPDAMTISSGKPVFYQPNPSNPDGYLLPYHLDSHATAAQKIPSMSLPNSHLAVFKNCVPGVFAGSFLSTTVRSMTICCPAGIIGKLLKVSTPSGLNGSAESATRATSASRSHVICPLGNAPPVRLISPAFAPPTKKPDSWNVRRMFRRARRSRTM